MTRQESPIQSVMAVTDNPGGRTYYAAAFDLLAIPIAFGGGLKPVLAGSSVPSQPAADDGDPC